MWEFIGLFVIVVPLWVCWWLWWYARQGDRRRDQEYDYGREFDLLISTEVQDTERDSQGYDTLIRRSLEYKYRLWLRYADAQGAITERYVSPYSWDGRILGAYCHLYRAPRNFRVDRIIELQSVV